MAGIMGWWNSMRTACAITAMLVAYPADAQCPSSLSCGTTTCEVGTEQQLRDALDCLANSNGCSHIVVPAGCVLDVESQIGINQSHNGVHIAIIGTIRYTEAGLSDRLFHIVGVDGLTVDGGGTITSDSIASEHLGGIAKVFGISQSSSNITIQNLTIHDMTTVIEVASGQSVQSLNVVNVHATDMVEYGYFISERTDATFRHCSVNNTLNQHPFRLYAYGNSVAPGVTVENCWSYHFGSKSGLWILEGDDARVDRFSSNQEIIFGPDPGWCMTPPPNPMPVPCANGPLTDTFARELQSTDFIQVEMGVDLCCLVNLCTPILHLGREPGDVAHTMQLQNTNWDSLSDDFEIAINPDFIGPNVEPVAYNYCFADIDRNNAVDVDDLVAVILAWGTCPPAPTGVGGPPPPCPADIVPHICGNDAVDVDDLIEVILGWGACPSHPECGAVSESSESLFSASAPTTAQECYDQCLAKYPEGGQDFINAYEKCVEGLILAEMLEP